jgi:hypothetical protein
LNLDFDDFLGALEEDAFEERPVDIEEFVTSKDYLMLPPLSEYQYTMIKASTQIYKKETLIKLFGEEEGTKRWNQTCNEVIFQLGKGSGKDYTSTIACAYVVYLLLCLKDPARYYGKPPGDSIDIINVAINAIQAQQVFFKGFKNRITRCRWFDGKYEAKMGSIVFDKSITVHSGHSQRESWEGYNLLFAVLDEISGFDLDSTSGYEQSKTASAIYKMFRGSVDSRFPQFGKVILLSFPRFKNDYIQQRYNEVVADKEIVIRKHTFKVDEDLPDETEGNEFSIEWEEDHILSYNVPKVFALKRPTWEINPTINIKDLAMNFYSDPIDALSRFACMPPEAIDALFHSREKVETAFSNLNVALDEKNSFKEWFQPDPEKSYYIHVDLAQKHDHCAVSMAHIDRWVTMKMSGAYTDAQPYVVVDAIRYWTPTKEKTVDFTEVKNYIISLKQRGFNIKRVTFDRWNSFDMMEQLKSYGMNCEVLSVAKKHYEDMLLCVMEERLSGPRIPLIIDELLELRIVKKDKVDHPRKGSKDLADATCGAIYNAISLTPKGDGELHVYSYDAFDEDLISEGRGKMDNTIRSPIQRTMPGSLRDYLGIDSDDDMPNPDTGFIDNFTIL